MAHGETTLVARRFMYSTVAFYLTTELVLTNRRFYAIRPNTFLGLIPVGTRRSSYPMDNIAGVNAGTHFHVAGVVLGLLVLLFGLAALRLPALGLLGVILLLLGINAMISAPKQAVEVMNSGGGVVRFPVSVLERRRTLEFANSVSEALARSAWSQPATTAAQSPGPTDATGALRELERIRADRLISDQEYAEKRSEILKRL